VEADFNATSFNVTFPADELPAALVTNIDVRVNIVDDDVNEKYQQIFLIGAEIAEAPNTSIINIGRNVTAGIIIDDDNRKLDSLLHSRHSFPNYNLRHRAMYWMMIR